MSHGTAEPCEGRAGTGPAAEPKGKPKKLPAAGGDERLFCSTATVWQAGGAGPRARGRSFTPEGLRWHSCSWWQSGQSSVCDGPSVFGTRDLWQRRGGGHGVWVGVPIVPAQGRGWSRAPCWKHHRASAVWQLSGLVTPAGTSWVPALLAKPFGRSPEIEVHVGQVPALGCALAPHTILAVVCPAPGTAGHGAAPRLSTALGSNVIVRLLLAPGRTDPRCSPRALCRPGGSLGI